jgi:hypothetical protein
MRGLVVERPLRCRGWRRALYALGIFGALFCYWQQPDSLSEYIWAILPQGNLLARVHGLRGFRARSARGP